jgi:hypothetical protein
MGTKENKRVDSREENSNLCLVVQFATPSILSWFLSYPVLPLSRALTLSPYLRQAPPIITKPPFPPKTPMSS